MEKQNKAARRVFIVQSGSVLEDSVESLLSQQPDLQVVSVRYVGDPEFVLAALGERPNVIVLFEGSRLSAGRVFDLLPGTASQALRVITVCSKSSALDVYDRQRLTAFQSQDLFAFVRQPPDAGKQSSA